MSRLSSDLLEQAKLLSGKDPTRPKQASIRRSISTSYYALFHYLVEECTGLLLGTGSGNKEFRQLLARAAVHGTMKSACYEVRKATPAPLYQAAFQSLAPAGAPELSLVAIAFIQLQEWRHQADYDVSATLSRQNSLNCYELAKEAFTAWKVLKTKNRQRAILFAILIFQFSTFSKR